MRGSNPEVSSDLQGTAYQSSLDTRTPWSAIRKQDKTSVISLPTLSELPSPDIDVSISSSRSQPHPFPDAFLPTFLVDVVIEPGPPAKPQLGTTYTKRPDTPPLDPAVGGAPWNTWGHGSASQFNVRTKGAVETSLPLNSN